MAKIKFFALILKNAFKLFFKFYDQYPIRTKLKSKENQFFQPLFLRTRHFCPILKMGLLIYSLF
ncbi:hypothetical protein BGL85_01755 [Helicobacter pylori]|nr:hypothetical protein BGL85_01755 [Helicobacter pylori]